MSRPLCTVLIPFDAPGQARFAVLKQVGEELGFETMRVAQYYSSGVILEEIVRSIRDAHLIIADLTGGNPNVYYELGIAHALGKRAFVLAEEPQACSLDFGTLPVRKFDTTPTGRERLLHELRTFVATPGTLSPIDLFTGGMAVMGQRLTGRRIAGFALDLLIAAVVAVVPLVLAGELVPQPATPYVERAIAPALFLYFVLTGVLQGTSPGQRIVGLRVTRLDRSRPLLSQRLLRPIFGLLSLLSLGFGFLWAARAPRHQAVHDIITRTLVLRRDAVGAQEIQTSS